MKRSGMLRPLLLLLLLLSGGLLMPRSAHAAVTCTATVSPGLTFGTYDPQSGTISTQTTLNWTCNASTTFLTGSAVTACFSIGSGSAGAGQTSPRQISGGGTPLQYQIYSQSTQGLAWGSVTNNNAVIRQATFPAFGSTTQTGSITIFGSILGIQPGVTAGVYSSSFTGTDAMISFDSVSNIALSGAPAPPASCGNGNDGNFPFTVQATVLRTCTVTAGTASNIDFGSVPANTSGSISANSNIQVTCLNGTPYIVGLQTTDGDTGSGRMSGTDPGNTADKVAYVLHRNSAAGPVWGNTGTTPANPGNDVGGNGNGLAQSIPVYAVVASANHIPGHYVDTVTVSVTY
jgi:spore coat protein U-like protein